MLPNQREKAVLLQAEAQMEPFWLSFGKTSYCIPLLHAVAQQLLHCLLSGEMNV